MPRLRVPCLVLVLVTLAACQGTATERFNAFPASTLADGNAFCAAWAPAECSRLQRCLPAEHAARERAGGCTSFTVTECRRTHAARLAAEARAEARINPRVAETCVRRTAALACTDARPSSCDDAWMGAVQEGKACSAREQCARGLTCSDATCGRCVPSGQAACRADVDCLAPARCFAGACSLPLLPGEDCSAWPDGCADGLTCLPWVSVCAATLAEGDPCADEPCGPGLTCVPRPEGAVCRVPAEAGEACGERPCRDEGTALTCSGGTCAAVTVAARGDACGDVRACSSADRCVDGTCVARPVAGEPCSAENTCFGATCMAGTCVAASRAGDPCTASCSGLACVNGACGLAECTPLDPPRGDGGAP